MNSSMNIHGVITVEVTTSIQQQGYEPYEVRKIKVTDSDGKTFELNLFSEGIVIEFINT